MSTSLVIVESPAKAKTISRFLGDDYVVEASIGSIRDLEPKGLAVDVDDDFKPTYVVMPDKRDVVKRLKAALKQADQVYLATDEDREGEAIAWHLAEILQPAVPMRRMVFHEITRQAIENAINRVARHRQRAGRRPGGPAHRRPPVRLPGVRGAVAQGGDRAVGRSGAEPVDPPGRRARARAHGVRARRLLGPAGGVPLRSPLLRRAGRARRRPGRQRQGLRQPGPGVPRRRGRRRRALGPGPGHGARRLDLHGVVGRREALPQLAQAAVHHLDPPAGGRPQARHDLGPGDAHRPGPVRAGLHHLHAHRLGDAVGGGADRRPHPGARAVRRQVRARRPPRTYRSKVQERPGGPRGHPPGRRPLAHPRPALGRAAQRRPAPLRPDLEAHAGLADGRRGGQDGVGAHRGAAGRRPRRGPGRSPARPPPRWAASGRTITFPGYLRVYVEGSDDPDADLDDRERLLPDLAVGQRAARARPSTRSGHTTQPPARYTEASLVKRLEELGIGRPSTYASIMQTIQGRGYVWKKGQALVPSWSAFAVVQLLEGHFTAEVDYSFTARMENDLDEIAAGSRDRVPFLHAFWFGNGPPGGRRRRRRRQRGHRLTTLIEAAMANADPAVVNAIPLGKDAEGDRDRGAQRALRPLRQAGRGRRPRCREGLAPDELTVDQALELLAAPKGDEPIGTDPARACPCTSKTGRFGPYVQLGDADTLPEGTKPKMASLFKTMSPATLTLDDALKLLQPAPHRGHRPGVGRGDRRPQRPLRALPKQGRRHPQPGQRGRAVHRHGRRRGAGCSPSPSAGVARPRRLRCASWAPTR